MLVWQLIQAIVNIDLMYFYSVIFDNLLFLFMFAALGYFMFPKRGLIWGVIMVTMISWIAIDFTAAVGWTLLSASFFCFHYIFRLAAVMFAETSDRLKKHIPLIIQLQFVVALIIFNYFIR
jgi:hypothetical protein